MLGILLSIAIIILALLGIAALISMHHARRSAGPFFPSSRATIRKALEGAELANGELFYDLGAGTAQALIIAEKEFGARAVGFEISILPFALGKINLFFHRAKAKLKFENLFEENLHDANVIFVFLAERVMAQTAEKIKHDAKPGTRIVTYAFELPGMNQIKKIPIHGEWNLFVYKQK